MLHTSHSSSAAASTAQNWTCKKPSAPGYYWMRYGPHDAYPEMVRVAKLVNCWMVEFFHKHDCHDLDEFCKGSPDAQWQDVPRPSP